MKIKFSFIIPVFNISKNLFNLINEILFLNRNDYEIIIVDDGSNSKIKIDNKKIKILRNKINSGPAIARNLGSKIAKGEYLFFIDSDIFIKKADIIKFINEIRLDKFDAIMGVYNPKSPLQNICSIYKNLYWSFNQSFILKNNNNFCTALFVMKKKIFQNVGGLNEKLRIGEDRDFGNRLLNYGYKFKSFTNCYIIHFKKLTFLGLIKHHYFNSVSVGMDFLKYYFISKANQNYKRKLSNKSQIRTLLASIIFIISTIK